MAGLFFCLASTRCGAFILPCCNTAPYNRLQRILSRPCSYTDRAAKQRTEIYRSFSGDCSPLNRRRYKTDTSGYDTTCATLERITSPVRHTPIPDTSATQGRYTGQYSRPIIIRYIRERPCYGSMPDSATHRRPCQPGGVSMLPTPGGLQSSTLYPAG